MNYKIHQKPKRAIILKALYTAGILILLLTFNSSLMAQQSIVRKPLLTVSPIDKHVSRVEIKEINFEPLQHTGLHLHPCPVVGYIAAGTANFQVKDSPLQTLKAGDAFFEPANTPIVHFDNASDTLPLKFIAYYLIDNEQELIKMLPDAK